MYCKDQMDAILRKYGVELPYDIFYPVEGRYLKFYENFIAALDLYFANTLEARMDRSQRAFTNLFVAFADGGADNNDEACAALDAYLTTLTGAING